MHRSFSRPWLLLLVTAPVLWAARPARADDPPAPPYEQRPLPVQPLPPVQPAQPLPQVQPVQPEAPPPPYAQPAYAPPEPYTPLVRDQPRLGSGNWYGWQTLIAVAPFDIAMFTGLARLGDSSGPATFAVGFVGRNLAPAVVHGAHGRGATAFGSVGLHAAATATGLVIGYAIGLALQGACPPLSPCRNGFRDLPPGLDYGAVAGSMSGTVLDVIFFAYRQKLSWTASAPADPAASTRTAWAFAPYAAPSTVGTAKGMATGMAAEGTW
jgi:hypothetical protein